jgi:hypothetical protein
VPEMLGRERETRTKDPVIYVRRVVNGTRGRCKHTSRGGRYGKANMITADYDIDMRII